MNFRMLGPFGGDQGQTWNLGPYNCSFCLLKIKIWYDNVVLGIQFYYSLNDQMKWSPIYGETGCCFAEVPLDNDVLTQIKVYVGEDNTYVSSLTFVTDKGGVFGPYGEEFGKKYDILIQGRIVGFYGTAGKQVNAIGVYTTA